MGRGTEDRISHGVSSDMSNKTYFAEKASELPADVDTTLKQGKHYTDYDYSVTDAEENVNN